MVNAAQLRAARALLNWSQAELAHRASVARGTVAAFENELKEPWPQNLQAMVQALEQAGIHFIDREDGVTGVLLATGSKDLAPVRRP